MTTNNPRDTRDTEDDSRRKSDAPRPQPPRRSRFQLISVGFWLLVLGGLAYWLLHHYGAFSSERQQIDYSDFRARVKKGQVERIEVRGKKIEGRLKKDAEPDDRKFVTHLPSFGDEKLLSLLENHQVEVHTEPEADNSWVLSLVTMLPILIFLALGYLFYKKMRTQGGRLFSMGKNRAKLYKKSAEHTKFDDVAGVENAKAELREVIEFLKHPQKYRTLGGKPPRGVLLVGPPGTGKTLLARAAAGEASVPFFSITGSDFMEMFVGVGASRVRNLFEDARKAAPAIVFIDELDSIGRERGAGLGGGHDEREQTLNQLLSEMDGFEPHESVVVMAATNRPDILDAALLRPGRFNRRVVVELPRVKARRKILEVHARSKPLADAVDLAELAQATPGFSGADLENLLNEAALLAGRRGQNKIDPRVLEEARDKILLGLKREGLALTDDERRQMAYHESGHALVAEIVPTADPVHKVTIVPRGRAMGVTQQLPERDRYMIAQPMLRDRLAVMMGGRAAELMVLQCPTSGAENDLKEAYRLARKMVLDWGMSEKLENLALGSDREHVFLGEELTQQRPYSEATAREIDLEIKKIVTEAAERANEVLRNHHSELDRIADRLLAVEELSGEDVRSLMSESKPSPKSAHG